MTANYWFAFFNLTLFGLVIIAAETIFRRVAKVNSQLEDLIQDLRRLTPDEDSVDWEIQRAMERDLFDSAGSKTIFHHPV